MAYYRLYFLDGDRHHILECREFEAADDAAAIVSSAKSQELGPMELWCRDRIVKRWRGRSRAEGASPPH